MSNVWAKHTNSFIARSDDGQEFTIHEFTEYHSSARAVGVEAGTSILRTEDDEEVNRLSKGEYEIVARGLRIHTDDPRAS
jgi:hypothetical protein